MAGPFSNADGFVPFLSDDNIARLSGYDPAASLYVQGGRDNRYFNHQSLEAGEGRMDVEASLITNDSQTDGSKNSENKDVHASKLAELRAKLIARRSTPSSSHISSDAPETSGNSLVASKSELMEQAPAHVPSKKSSNMDIDGLLAEGRAVADAKSKAKQNSQQTKQGDRNKTLIPSTATPKQSQSNLQNGKQPSSNSKSSSIQQDDATNSLEAGEIREDATFTSPTPVNTSTKLNKPTDARSGPDAQERGPQKGNSPSSNDGNSIAIGGGRPLIEKRPPPPIRNKTTSTMYDQDQDKSRNESSRLSSKSTGLFVGLKSSSNSEKPPVDQHEATVATATKGEVPDHLHEWLELTGWFNVDYRQRLLDRHKRRKDLTYQLAKLAQEEEADKDFLTRAQSASIIDPYRSSSKPPILATPVQTLPGAPPFSTEKYPEHGKKRSLSPAQEAQQAGKTRTKVARHDRNSRTQDEGEPKLGESEGGLGYRIRGKVDEALTHGLNSARLGERNGRDVSPHRSESPEHRLPYRTERYESSRPVDNIRQPPYKEPYEEKPLRRYAYSHNYDKVFRKTQNPDRSYPKPPRFQRILRTPSRAADVSSNARYDANSLELDRGGVRYFMIKSWNHENVLAAKQDSTWATQEKNAELLTEAFNNSRHVILFFSVNKSTAFQGYARMESLPGTAEVPSWAKKLHWTTSPPFHIRWITEAETHFRYVGHLKNPYNEGHAVLVGRDGQEIEATCGAELCKLIDDQEAFRPSFY